MRIEINSPVWYTVAVLIAGCGACTDLKYHKIYNKLTMPSILTGMICHLIFGGLLSSLLGILLGFSAVVFCWMGMLKAGDVKLYMAAGALAGWEFCGYTIVFSILLGGAAATVLMVSRRTGRASLKRVKRYLIHLLYTRQFCPYQPEEESAYFSFGCSIFAGTLAAFWYLLFYS